jgi:uncharacterized membrane protein YfcA
MQVASIVVTFSRETMDPTILYILFITFAATLIRSTFGFGESLVAVPLLILFLPIEVAVPLSVLLSIIIALIVVVQDHEKIHLGSAKWLILFAIPGIPLGLGILLYGEEIIVKAGLGAMIIFYSLYVLFGKKTIGLQSDSALWLFICGFLSGVFGGAYGLNGPPLVVYGNMRQWSAMHFRATLQAYFLPASFLGMVGYFLKGMVTMTVLKYFLIALPVVVPTIFLGRYLNRKLHGNSFYQHVHWGLMIIGAVLIADSLM